MDNTVLWHLTMSLDGFIAGRDDTMDWAFGYSGPNPVGDAVREGTGAILAGRRWYDVATRRYDGRAGIYGGAWTGPVFVLTHEPPETSEDPGITFLSDGVPDAVATTRAAAGGNAIEIFGANVARQCLEHGLLDEIVVHVAPVLLGDGVRLFGGPGAPRVELERTHLSEAGQLSTMRFRVPR
jgi:dihydrofolate reductase